MTRHLYKRGGHAYRGKRNGRGKRLLSKITRGLAPVRPETWQQITAKNP